MKQLLDATIETLEQLKSLVLICQGESYNIPCEHSLSGVGRHVRHILDHFVTVREGMEARTINYNKRSRNSRLEDEPAEAVALIDDLIDWMNNSNIQNEKVWVETEVSVSHTQNMVVTSSLSREFCYLINHTVHHLAYAKMVAGQLGFDVDRTVGLAPSTATYLRQTAYS
ncbi:DinB family protein [Sessilibacter sp. MAH2]